MPTSVLEEQEDEVVQNRPPENICLDTALPRCRAYGASEQHLGHGGGVGGVAEASQRLLGVEERLGDFPFSLARGPGFEASLDAWKIAGHAARVSFF